jgi:hypothetical protein
MRHLFKPDNRTGLIRYLCSDQLRVREHFKLTRLPLRCDCLDCAKVKAKELLAEGKREELEELFIRFRIGMGDLRV